MPNNSITRSQLNDISDRVSEIGNNLDAVIMVVASEAQQGNQGGVVTMHNVELLLDMVRNHVREVHAEIGGYRNSIDGDVVEAA